jgi:methionyl-tRNA formyltransferase
MTLPPLKIVFLGAGEFALPTLERLAAEFPAENLLVVSQPDRARGRGRKKAATPVSLKARELGLKLLTPKNVNSPESRAAMEEFAPDYLVLVDFGTRLAPETIALPKKAAINLHPSLLPAYRGPAPMAWALIRGEPVTGVTTQLISEKIDCGSILIQDPTFIRDHETLPELSRRLSEIGAPLVIATLEGLESGELEPRPQDESLASKAPKFRKEDGLINWQDDAAAIFNRIRGLNPWPGTYTFHRGKRTKILRARPLAEPLLLPPAPGELRADGERLLVGCGQNSVLEILELQPAGKPVRTAAQFIHGRQLKQPDHFSAG